MRKTNFIKSLSFVMAFLMVFSVITLPKITAKADGIDDFICRCYKVTLGRDADSDGYAYWRDILVNRKQDGSVVAHGFLFSPEYENKQTPPEQYVKDLYMLFMGREPEESGYDYWCEKMANGESREQIFAGFANSKEYFDLCNGYGITAGYYSADYGIQQVNGVNLFVERMYQTSLGRLGDQGGQNDWVQDLLSGRITGIECARCFVQSPEFINKGLSDEDYLKSLYKAFMGREYDQGGLDYWLENIKNGYTRDEVFAGFANSPEFEGICNFYGIIRGDYTPTDIGTKKDPNNNDDPGDNDNPVVSLTEAKVGDLVKLGKYEQDNNIANGKEDIEWRVLEIEGNRALLISEYSLDCQPYNAAGSETNWENSSLRQWLNNDFINTAFSENEQSQIVFVPLENDNGPLKMDEVTVDKVFCISHPDLKKYFNATDTDAIGGLKTDSFICYPTEYAKSRGAVLNDRGNYSWVTRSVYNQKVVFVNGNFIQPYYPWCNETFDKTLPIRPAVYVDIVPEDKTPQITNIKAGDIVKLGKYEQDGDLSNGKEDIEWRVLDVEGNKALLVSEYILETTNFYDDTIWETSETRQWLNKIFLYNAFTEAERNIIPESLIVNKENPYNHASNGNNTRDRVFLLSTEEVEKYFGDYNVYYEDKMCGYNQNLLCSPTNYLISQGNYFTVTEDIYNDDRTSIDGTTWAFFKVRYIYTRDILGKKVSNWALRDGYVQNNGGAGAGVENLEGSHGGFALRPAIYIEY